MKRGTIALARSLCSQITDDYDGVFGSVDIAEILSVEVERLRQRVAELEALAQDRLEPMKEVADRFAHRLALELECVLADRNVNWDRAINLIGEYRSAMNAIHEQHSPTFMGEPVIGGPTP
jgi:hypothetical protein